MRLLFVLFFLLMVGCSKELPKGEFESYYEKKCKAEIVRNNMSFNALFLTSEYEKAKWGKVLDSGYRVLFWVVPRTQGSFREAYFLSEGDTIRPVTYRKAPVFETGNTDSFVLAFTTKPENMELHIEDFGAGFGNFIFDLKECKHIRLLQEGNNEKK